MDHRELETRLRTHLHRRFDDATPSRELTAGVQQILRTEPRGVRLDELRWRSLSLSWSVLGVAALVAILAVAAIRIGAVVGPGDRGSNVPPSPTVAPPAVRPFIVLPPFGSSPSKGESTLAEDILSARLSALGFGNFTSGTGLAIEFEVPIEGSTDASIRNVLSATGDVEFVPLPAADYGDGGLTAVVGEPLPKDEPALFGWDGIASVTIGDDAQARRVLNIVLKPAARAAFATYTETHIGETFAVVIDGRVALLPMINEPITGGEIAISGGGESDDFEETMAILVGGMLPESWAEPGVPILLPEAHIVASVLREAPNATVVSTELDAIRDGEMWIEVWVVTVEGEFHPSCPAGATPCPTFHTLVVTVNASAGDAISREFSP
jgi:hypothetical protein